MEQILNVNYDSDRITVSARELHKQLGIEKRFSAWFETNSKGFVENEDFCGAYLKVQGNQYGGEQEVQDYQLTLDMAKHLCLMSRTEKGKRARQYLIDLEKDWNSPEKVMARALVTAQKKLADLDERNKLLEIDNSRLTVSNQIMQPKADYFDELVDRNLLTNFRQTAKELKVKEKVFVNFLINKNYIYRDTKGKLMPRAGKSTDLFEVKETFNEKTQWSGVQTLITPKGRETFRLLLQGERNE